MKRTGRTVGADRTTHDGQAAVKQSKEGRDRKTGEAGKQGESKWRPCKGVLPSS